MRLLGTKLHMTITFHPQSDGQTEAANRVIVMYLHNLRFHDLINCCGSSLGE